MLPIKLLNSSGSSRLNSIEAFDLAGSGNNSLSLALSDLRDLTGFNWLNSSTASTLGFSNGTYSLESTESKRQLLIKGNTGDSLTVIDGSWSDLGTITDGSNTYDVYSSSSGTEQLLINQTISTAADIT